MAYSKMIEDLCIIEEAQHNDYLKSKIAQLLVNLQSEYPNSEQEIGDATAVAFREIKKSGVSVSIISIMEAMMKIADAKTGQSYHDMITAYITLRRSDLS